MSVTRTTCCNCASKVIDLQNEVKIWKTKSHIQQKWRKILQDWILHTFGYDVKVEMERETQTARIQAIENKTAMKTASIQLIQQEESSESEVKVVVMEVKMDDDCMDMDETVFPEINNAEPEKTTVTIANSNNAQGHIETAVPVEIGTGPNTEVVYITGNYNEEANSGEIPSSSYFILRSSDNEDMSMQIDCSHFMNGDIIQGDNNTFYRIATARPDNVNRGSQIENLIQQTPMLLNSSSPLQYSPSSYILSPSPQQNVKVVKKRRAPKSAINSSDNAKPVTVPKPRKRPIKGQLELPNTSDPTPTKPLTKAQLAAQKKEKNPTPNPPIQKSTSEFGLTLREKAEVYVQSKARNAVSKVNNGYECNICTTKAYKYSSIDSCMTHTKSHFEGKPYKCESCDELFAIQKDLLNHKREIHPRIKPAVLGVPDVRASVAASNATAAKLARSNEAVKERDDKKRNLPPKSSTTNSNSQSTQFIHSNTSLVSSVVTKQEVNF